jgi:hypothetical protein
MERVGDRQGRIERYCSTGQRPQRAVAPTEEEEELVTWVCAFQMASLLFRVNSFRFTEFAGC